MALIKCPECGKEISSSATNCPNCGHPIAPKQQEVVEKTIIKEKKKGGCLTALVAVLLLFILFVIIFTVLSDDSDDKAKKVGNSNLSDNTGEATKDLFEVGEIAEYNDIQVSVLDFETSNGNNFSKPDSGKEFVYVNVEIANNSDDELTVSSLLSFDAYCDDYKLDFSSGALLALDGRNQLDGKISEGKKMNGYLGLEVPSDWKTIELQFTDNVWKSSKIKFEIKNN